MYCVYYGTKRHVYQNLRNCILSSYLEYARQYPSLKHFEYCDNNEKHQHVVADILDGDRYQSKANIFGVIIPNYGFVGKHPRKGTIHQEEWDLNKKKRQIELSQKITSIDQQVPDKEECEQGKGCECIESVYKKYGHQEAQKY